MARPARAARSGPRTRAGRSTVAGWVATRRDHGGLVFVDLRDEEGLAAGRVNPENAPAAAETAHALRNEFVIRARGDGRAARARRP